MASSVLYSKYHEWRDHGFPYDVGVALLRELHIFPAFANLCAARRNANNEAKLRVILQKGLKDVPGVAPVVGLPGSFVGSQLPVVGLPGSVVGSQLPVVGLPTQPPATANDAGSAQPDNGQPTTDNARLAPPAQPDNRQPTADNARLAPPTPSQAWRLHTMAQTQALSTLPPKPADVVPIHSTSGLKAVPFENLPPELKPGRIKLIEMSGEREHLHAALLPVPAAAQCIHFRDMLRLMEQKDATGKPVPFTLKRFTYNRKTRMGGELLTVHQAVLHTEASQANPRSYIERQASRAATGKDPSARHKPGDHWKNATRNLQMPDGSLDKCIIWLIVEINGLRVVMGKNPSTQEQGQDAGTLCRRIVQLSDAINAQWDAERLWADKGTLPFVPASFEATIRSYTDAQLDQLEENQVNPAIYRANKALRTAEGDSRELWLRKQNEALLKRAALNTVREERKAEGEKAVEKILAKSAVKKVKKKMGRKPRRKQ